MVREDLRPGQNVRFTGFVKIPNLSCRKVIHKTSLQQRGTHVTLFLPVTGNNMGTQNSAGLPLTVLESEVQHEVAELKPKAAALQRLGGESL